MNRKRSQPSPLSYKHYIITSDGITKLLLSGLDIYKAPGPDNISLWVFKQLYDVIVPILVIIFNASLQNHVVPQDWNFANITPIFEMETMSSHATSYRPTYLTNL